MRLEEIVMLNELVMLKILTFFVTWKLKFEIEKVTLIRVELKLKI